MSSVRAAEDALDRLQDERQDRDEKVDEYLDKLQEKRGYHAENRYDCIHREMVSQASPGERRTKPDGAHRDYLDADIHDNERDRELA